MEIIPFTDMLRSVSQVTLDSVKETVTPPVVAFCVLYLLICYLPCYRLQEGSYQGIARIRTQRQKLGFNLKTRKAKQSGH